AKEADLLADVAVLCGQRLKMLRQFHLGQRGRQIERPLQAQVLRDASEKFVDRTDADRLQHGCDVVGSVVEVRHCKCRIQKGECRMKGGFSTLSLPTHIVFRMPPRPSVSSRTIRR